MSDPRAGMMVTSNVRLVRPLSEGGMGSVWVADHLSLRTSVVVKFMARELATSRDALARFSREAAAASQVKSPHVVQMLDHGIDDDGAAYIVMELLEGKDLASTLRSRGRLPPSELVAIVTQLARALSKAHERGIVHRDIKPSNVFLLDAGSGELFVKLLDFGIAKAPEGGLMGTTTRTGSLLGSPYYMSPEQVVGARDVDFKTDLWSLGVLAFEALTGARPFFAPTLGALVLKIHRDPLPVPSAANPAVPAAFDRWFAQACAREPEGRFASAKEMADSLARAVLGETASAGTPSQPRDGLPSFGDRARLAHARAAAVSPTGSGSNEPSASDSSNTSKSARASAAARVWVLGAMAALVVGAALLAALFTGTAKAIATPSHAPAALVPPEPRRAEDPSSATVVSAQATGRAPADWDARPLDAAIEDALANLRAPSLKGRPSPSQRRPVSLAATSPPNASPAPPVPGESDDDIK
ncbi:MAG: serine/threonine protein kinase [Myxococcota bacterium]|nr:serine/threonine protein kinase [Myxococcota bacterium]